jgi:hypothetical protein
MTDLIDQWLASVGDELAASTARLAEPITPTITPSTELEPTEMPPTDPIAARAARIIEATGVSEAEAMNRARRASAAEGGEPFPATQEEIDAMSVAEFKAYYDAGGELPTDEAAPFSIEALNAAITPEVLAANGITDEDMSRTGGVDNSVVEANGAERVLQANVQSQIDAAAKSFVASGYSPDEAKVISEASRDHLVRLARDKAGASVPFSAQEQARVKAMSKAEQRAFLGLADEGGEE